MLSERLNDLDDRSTVLLERLRQRQCRLTPQRVALINLLTEGRDHPSAGSLYARLAERYPTMSLGTVYKTLTLLKEMGEVLELTLSDGVVHYDIQRTRPHSHLICVGCHKVTDAPPELDRAADLPLKDPAGFRITGRRLDLYGLCLSCQDRAMATPAGSVSS